MGGGNFDVHYCKLSKELHRGKKESCLKLQVIKPEVCGQFSQNIVRSYTVNRIITSQLKEKEKARRHSYILRLFWIFLLLNQQSHFRNSQYEASEVLKHKSDNAF